MQAVVLRRQARRAENGGSQEGKSSTTDNYCALSPLRGIAQKKGRQKPYFSARRGKSIGEGGSAVKVGSVKIHNFSVSMATSVAFSSCYFAFRKNNASGGKKMDCMGPRDELPIKSARFKNRT